MLTLVADNNIAHLQDYFNQDNLGVPINLITMAGRDINANVIAKYQPDALLIRSVTNIDASLLADNDSVRFVGSATIGTDHVDTAYLSKRNIVFTNAAGSSKHSVAQYVMTAILTLRPQYWSEIMPTLGIIGLGNIGSTLAHYAKSLGWTVLGTDPFKEASNINNASFEAVLQQSDVVSLHVPLTTAQQSPHPTYHLINQSALDKMTKQTLLINTARGAVISETALLTEMTKHNGKESKVLDNQRQVVLDVFEHEPTVSAALLNQLQITTPHIAGYTLEGKLRGTQMIFDAFVEVFNDKFDDEKRVQPVQLMSQLLPSNPYQWSVLKDTPAKLSEFYNIKADHHLLMSALDSDSQQVNGKGFDALRKNYHLRREWLFDDDEYDTSGQY